MADVPSSADPSTPDRVVPEPIPVPRWRKLLWSVLAVTAIAPGVLGAAALGTINLLQANPGLRRAFGQSPLPIVLPVVVAGIAAGWTVRRGLRRGWPARDRMLVGWGAGAVVAGGGVVVLGVMAMQQVRFASKQKAMIPRQPAAAVDQFFLENPDRIFVKYDEIAGPGKYIKGYTPIDGEDPAAQYPLRRYWCETLPVELPDGTTVRRNEVLAQVGRSGIVSTYPKPQDKKYDPKRVYRLDSGVCFRNDRVVDLPPDPAGREGRDQDGVHIFKLPDGRRFEITYRNGTPDGPFRAFHADGAPWGEATYRGGRLAEARLFTRDGRTFDELAQGAAAQLAITKSNRDASREARDRGTAHLEAQRPGAAIGEFTRALAFTPDDALLFRTRGDAYLARGNLNNALRDYAAADAFTPPKEVNPGMPEALRQRLLERGRKRRQAGDLAGADADFARLAEDAPRAADSFLRRGDPQGALRVLTETIEARPTAELLAARADRRRTLAGEQGAAEADYSRALELARQGEMQSTAKRDSLRALWHYRRGHVRRWRRNSADAAEDFRAAVAALGAAPPGDTVSRGDAAAWRFVALRESGQGDEAARELRNTERKEWRRANLAIARFLLGEITVAELDGAVVRSPQESDRQKVELISGLVLRLDGDEAAADVRIRRASQRTAGEPIEADTARVSLGAP